MAIFYVETSALAKLYKHEKGSEVLEFLFGQKLSEHRIVISFLSIIPDYAWTGWDVAHGFSLAGWER